MANMQDNVMIRMEDIHKSYGDVEVLKGIVIVVLRRQLRSTQATSLLG